MPTARSFRTDPLGRINEFRTLLREKYFDTSILRELIQNADDAGATCVLIGQAEQLPGNPCHPLLKGPGLFVVNDGPFTEKNADAICMFGQNYKSGEVNAIGKFGLGLKSVFHWCEAFFYVHSIPPAAADPTEKLSNLANPWVGTGKHPEWDNVADSDIGLLRAFLDAQIRPALEKWFALWLPLRRQSHSPLKIGEKYPGDSRGCPEALKLAAQSAPLWSSLPLLKTVNQVEVWDGIPNANGIRIASYNLPSTSARTSFADFASDHPPTHTPPRSGWYESSSAERVEYAFAESWISEPWVKECQGDTAWPQVYDADGNSQPDKAQPHAAVVLARQIDHRVSSLNVTTAVFLPLEGPQEGPHSDENTPEFLLTLHGCFFINSDRRHAIHSGAGVCGRWNTRLWEEGVYPLILPAVAELAAGLEDDPAAVRRLTECLFVAKRYPIDSQTIYAENRTAVSKAGDWLYRWTPTGGSWQLVERRDGVPRLEIPDFGENEALPGRALPQLVGLTADVVLTPNGWPRLTADDPRAWSDEQLGIVLAIDDPRPLFEDDGAGLKYFLKFLDESPARGPAALAALRGTLRSIFTLDATKVLQEHQETLRSLVGHLRASERRALPLGGNWPVEVRRRVCACGGDVLIVPDGLQPEDDLGNAAISENEAEAMLTILAESMSPGRNTNPALEVLKAVANLAVVADATASLGLWIVQRVGRGKVEAEVCSLAELRAAPAAFRGPVNDDLRALADAVTTPLV